MTCKVNSTEKVERGAFEFIHKYVNRKEEQRQAVQTF
jgi:hypothetical protein